MMGAQIHNFQVRSQTVCKRGFRASVSACATLKTKKYASVPACPLHCPAAAENCSSGLRTSHTKYKVVFDN